MMLVCVCVYKAGGVKHGGGFDVRRQKGEWWTAKRLLEQEIQVLGALLYKNRNQHGSSIFYRKLQHVYRLYTKKMREGMQCEWCGFESKVVNVAPQRKGSHVRMVPSAVQGVEEMQKILWMCKHLVLMNRICLKAGRVCSYQLAQSFFMPLSLTCLAIVSRVQTLSAHCLQLMCRRYNSMVDIVCILPCVDDVPESVRWMPEHVLCKTEPGKMPTVRYRGWRHAHRPDGGGGGDDRIADGGDDGDMLWLTNEDVEDSSVSLHHAMQLKKEEMMASDVPYGIHPIDSSHQAPLNFIEDRGIPISREDVRRMVVEDDDVPHVDVVIPSFQVSDRVSDLFITPKAPTPDKEQNRATSKINTSPQKKDLVIKPSVAPLPCSMKEQKGEGTAFIRIGGGTTSVQRQQAPQSEKKDTASPSTGHDASWEDWISKPITSQSAAHQQHMNPHSTSTGGANTLTFNTTKKKRKKRRFGGL